MTTGRKNLVKLTVIILATLLLSSQTFALNTLGKDTTKTQDKEIPEAAIKNYAKGIESNNLGLKRCCIYLAGFYEIKELVQPLTEQLAKETDPNTKILIVLTLYKIGDTGAQKAIQKLANKNADPGLKDLAKTVINKFKIHSSFKNN